jgi:diguanylate cyclase (GGDEF)-like protein/PAS domain S-box-containing protein
MKAIRSASVPVFILLLIFGLGAVAVVMASRAAETAKELRTGAAFESVQSMSQAVNRMLDTGQVRTAALEGGAPSWVASPGHERDTALLQRLLVGDFYALALFDGHGRRVNQAGPVELIPAADDPGHEPIFRILETIDFGFSHVMTTASGTRIFGMGVRARTNPDVVFVLYASTETVALHHLLAAPTSGGAYYLVDDNGRVQLEASGSETDLVFPEVAAMPDEPGMTASAGTVMVAGPSNAYGLRLVYRSDTGTFFGGIDSANRRGVTALTISLVVAATAVAFIWHRRQTALRDGSDRLEALVANVRDAVLVVDQGRVTYATPAVRPVLEISSDDAVGAALADLVGDEAAGRLLELIEAADPVAGPARPTEVSCRTPGGRLIWAEATVTRCPDVRSIRGAVVALDDVTERRAARERLRHQASHDRLTELNNRGAFVDRVDQALCGRQPGSGTVTVLFLDLDDFKPVNDLLGHAAGDHVLKVVARRVKANIRPDDMAARLGGDEFGIVTSMPATAETIASLASRLIAAINDHVWGRGNPDWGQHRGGRHGWARGRRGCRSSRCRPGDVYGQGRREEPLPRGVQRLCYSVFVADAACAGDVGVNGGARRVPISSFMAQIAVAPAGCGERRAIGPWDRVGYARGVWSSRSWMTRATDRACRRIPVGVSRHSALRAAASVCREAPCCCMWRIRSRASSNGARSSLRPGEPLAVAPCSLSPGPDVAGAATSQVSNAMCGSGRAHKTLAQPMVPSWSTCA